MNFTITNKAFAKNIFLKLLNEIDTHGGNSIYRLSFEKVKSTKTRKQLGFIFGGIIKSIVLYFDSLGYRFTAEQIKEWLYEEIGTAETITFPNGSHKTLKRTLSAMTKQEASYFIFKLFEFIDSSEALRDFVLTPDLRYCWTNHVDVRLYEAVKLSKFPERNEEYLRYQRKLTCIHCGRRGCEVHHIKKGSGLGRKNPDWFSIPLCHDCHIGYLHSQNGEDKLLQQIKRTIGGLDIEVFCRVAYYLWLHNY